MFLRRATSVIGAGVMSSAALASSGVVPSVAAPGSGLAAGWAASLVLESTMVQATAARRHGFGFGASKKGGARLTAAEQAKRRMGKTPDEKRAAREAEDDAEQFTTQVWPDEVESQCDRRVDAARVALLKLQNPVLALEKITLEVGGAKRPLVQLGTLVRANAKELVLTPHDASQQALLMSKLARYDPTLQPQKSDDKIKLTIQPVTRERREGIVAFIEDKNRELKERQGAMRRKGVDTIKGFKLTSTDVSAALEEQVIQTLSDKIEAADAIFVQLADEAMELEDDVVEDARDNV